MDTALGNTVLCLWYLFNKALFSREEIKDACLNGVLIGKGNRSLLRHQ